MDRMSPWTRRTESGPCGRFTAMTEADERARSDVTSIGWVDGRLWLYLGQTALEEGEALAWEATRFRVRSCRPYYIGNALSHYWAALEQEREAAECGS